MYLSGTYIVGKQSVSLCPEESRQAERDLRALHATVTSNGVRTGSGIGFGLLNTPLKKQALDWRQVFNYTWDPEGENVTILSSLGLINLLDVTSRDSMVPFIIFSLDKGTLISSLY